MASTESGVPSIVEHTRAVAAGAPVIGIHFLGRTAAFVLGEETLLFAALDGAGQRVPVPAGGILASACDGRRIVTAGDDGKVVETSANGEAKVLATDAKRRWIDHVALG